MNPNITARATLFTALKDFLPTTLGIIPFAIVFGVSASEIGISTVQGLFMSGFILAGAAQLVTVELLKTDALAWVIILSALVVNLRFVIYSASLSTYFKSLPLFRRIIAAYLLTDQPYAMSVTRFNSYPDTPHKFWYYIGHAFGLWAVWMVFSYVGLVLGPIVPESWSLGFIIPLMFIGLAVPSIKDKSYIIAALVSGISVVALESLPNNLGLMIAILLGIIAGVIAGRLQ